ncbi:MAG: beta-lactamase family protein, partial [Bacteroidales bacterium]|nr:beta-lactamase family protein [Bacteroidales bacterium]
MKLLITMILTVLSGIQTIDGQMQKTLDDIRSRYGLMGLSVVRVSKGEITGIYHSGLRDLERNLPVTDSTKFRIASISKLITTTALMKLHD